MTQQFETIEDALDEAVIRLNGRAWGMAVGLVLGILLFAATNLLVLKGGPRVGAHLSLLGEYFPGYSVTFAGSLVGFFYTFVAGYLLGLTVGTVYNRVAGLDD